MQLQPSQILDPRSPFSREDARRAGVTLRELTGIRYQRLFHDVYVGAGVRVDVRTRSQAALAVAPPGSFLSHATAAEFWGAVVPDGGLIHVSVPTGSSRCERQGIRAHRSRAAAMTSVRDGIATSTPAQALLEMAGDGVGLIDLVVAGDGLVKAGRVGPDELKELAARAHGCGAEVFRRATSLVREGVDSAMETRLRLLLVLAGLPEPQVNHVLRGNDGLWRIRLDLAFPGLKVAIEYDGRQHAESTTQWKRDLRRREELDRLGWRLIVIQSEDIFDHPGETLDRISDLLRELGRPIRHAYRPEWRRFFPGRSR